MLQVLPHWFGWVATKVEAHDVGLDDRDTALNAFPLPLKSRDAGPVSKWADLLQSPSANGLIGSPTSA
jgi:hypothetical protein